MSAAKHTPGPWVMSRYGAIVGGPAFQFANGSAQKQVAMACVVPEGVEGDQLANARLIAAAPELLEALQGLLIEAVVLSDGYLAAFESYPADATIQGWDKARWLRAADQAKRARAAIAKATGSAA